MSILCSHDDDLIDKTILPSGWEQMAAAEKNIKFDRLYASVYSKTVVYVFKCKKCGRSRVHKEVSA